MFNLYDFFEFFRVFGGYFLFDIKVKGFFLMF